MKPLPARLLFSLRQAALAALLASALGGCVNVHRFNSKHDTTIGPKREVANVHQTSALPKQLRRVALLPMHLGNYEHVEMAAIQESFLQELAKRNAFEIVAVPPELLREAFGRGSFSSVETLPTKLLTKLHEVYAIDGALFIDVTFFNGYQPVGLGIRAKLLDGHTGDLVWAADELFDSADPKVSNAARKYFQTQSVGEYPLQLQTQTVLHSPARFSKYVANAVFSTLK